MFAGTAGWVLKPRVLLGQEQGLMKRKVEFEVEIFGISSRGFLCAFGRSSFELLASVPPPNGRGDQQFGVHIRAELLHTQDDIVWCSEVIMTGAKVDVGADVAWSDARFKLEYDEDDLAFLRYVATSFLDRHPAHYVSLRLLICNANTTVAVFCVRANYLPQGWRLVHMLGIDGKQLGTTMLVKFTITNVKQDDGGM